jgi:hypothetical protein
MEQNNQHTDLSLTLPDDCIRILQSKEFSDKIMLFYGFWSLNDCRESPKSLFVFGDNDVHQGVGGQAIIRTCANTIGIPTKKYPNNNIQSFYTDKTYADNCKKIYAAVSNLIKKSVEYDEIVFPENGFGTGLAKLSEKAPKTLAYLDKLIEDVFGIEYESIRKNGLQIGFNLPDDLK